MKKAKIVFGLFVLLFMVIVANPSWVSAASEAEPNDSKDTATKISLNTEVTGDTTGSKDSTDWYKFTITSAGYVTIDFEHTLVESSSTYWRLYIYDSDGVNYLIPGDYGYYSAVGNQNTKTAGVGLEPGTYYIKVYRYNSLNSAYKLKVNYTKTSEWEIEGNNTVATATTVNVNKTYKGSIWHTDDVDYYKFTTTENGYIKIDFEHELFDSTSDYWRIRLYDSTGVNLVAGGTSNYDYFGVTGINSRTPSNIGLPAGTYYIKIANYEYSQLGHDNNYSLKINFTKADNWETEYNSSWENADEIKVNQVYYGSISYSDDEDWYKFSLPSTCEVAIQFNHGAINSTRIYWYVYLYDSTGTLQKLKLNCAGNKESMLSDYVTLEKGTYTIVITDYERAAIDYNFSVSERHTCAGDWVITQEATCTTAGIREKHCYICNKLLGTPSTITKISHTYSGWTVTKKASCTEEGLRYAKCTVCGDMKREVIEKTAHNFSVWKTDVEATCNSTGVSVRSCSVCGSKQSSTINKLTHIYGAWKIVSEATCQKAGSEERYCSLCGGVESRNIDKLFHIYGEWQVNTEATCQSAGLQERFCTKCGTSETKAIVQLTHRYSDWKESTPATCHAEGKEEKICTLCGNVESRVVSKLIHKYGEWEVVSGGKVIPPIVKEKTCEYCNDTEQIRDWGYAWVSVVVAVVLLGIFIGMLYFFNGMKKNNRKDDVMD